MPDANAGLEEQVALLRAEAAEFRDSLLRYEQMLSATRLSSPGVGDAFRLQVAPALKWTAGLLATLLCALLVSTVQLAWSNQERLVTVEANQRNVMSKLTEMTVSLREINSELEARREYYDRMNDALRKDMQRDVDDLRRRLAR